MTNEELAELLAKVKYTAEHGVFDAAEKSMLADMEVVGTALQSLIATAREAEALRAENARLREGFTIADEVACDAIRNGYYVGEGAAEKLVAARAALEQGEVK